MFLTPIGVVSAKMGLIRHVTKRRFNAALVLGLDCNRVPSVVFMGSKAINRHHSGTIIASTGIKTVELGLICGSVAVANTGSFNVCRESWNFVFVLYVVLIVLISQVSSY